VNILEVAQVILELEPEKWWAKVAWHFNKSILHG